jgi:hypothetical protein
LNKQLFCGLLPPDDEIEIVIFTEEFDSEAWAYCEYDDVSKKFTLFFSEDIEETKFLKQIVAHEMVHMTQQLSYNCMSHGKKTFFNWTEKFESCGIDLSENY